jgi:fermentation-respiration switch protein FrsA (DUF1100 family)
MKNLLLTFFLFASLAVSAQQTMQITFKSNGTVLYGTLTIPAGNGPFPVVILVHGSGPNDRDETFQITASSSCIYPCLTGKTLKPFKDIALELQKKGIAVLRYDKRTYTYAQSIDLNKFSHYELVADISNAVEYLKTRPEVNKDQIFLAGHSEGGVFVPMAASRRNDIAGIISLAAPAERLDSTMVDQFRYIYTKCSDSASGNVAASQINDIMYKLRNNQYPADTNIMGLTPRLWREWLGMFDSSIYYYKKIDRPILFIQGLADYNVLPAKNFSVFRSQITSPANWYVTYDSMIHELTYNCTPIVPKSLPDTIAAFLQHVWTGIGTQTQDKPSPPTYTYRSGTLNIIWPDKESAPSKLMIYDLSGKRMLNYTGKPDTGNVLHINCSALKPGIYIVKWNTDNAGTDSLKIIIPQ